MMDLYLKNITFFILNLEEDKEKRLFMEGQMRELDFNYVFIPAIKTKPGTVGIALSHLKVLRMAPQMPFAILEDDCKFLFDRIKTCISLPPETDGYYLGHSHFGLNEKVHEGVQWGKSYQVKYSVFNQEYLKIEAMLARHAVIFLSEKLRNNAIQANLRALCNFNYYYPGDLAYAQIQPHHLILSPYDPWCYQSEIFGGNWMATRHSIMTTVPLQKG